MYGRGIDLKILLVNSDQDFIDNFKYSFKTEDYTITSTKTIKEAIDAFTKYHYDLAIIDIPIAYEEDFDKLVKQCLLSMRARLRADEARKGKKSTSKTIEKPDIEKLYDMTSFPRDLCEEYVVEGTSAGGSAKNAAESMKCGWIPRQEARNALIAPEERCCRASMTWLRKSRR